MNARAEELLEDAEFDQLDTELKISNFFTGIAEAGGEGVTIGIYEVDEDDRRRRSFLFAIEPGIEPHELFSQILEQHGAGEYEALAREANRITFDQRFRVGTTKKKKAAVPINPDRPLPGAPTTGAAVDPNLLRILDGQQRAIDGQTKILESIAANLSKPAPAPKSLLEQATDLAALKDLFTPPAGATVASMAKEFFALKDLFGSESESGSDPLGYAVKSLMPLITKAVEKMDAVDHRSRARAYRTAEDLGRPGGPPAALDPAAIPRAEAPPPAMPGAAIPGIPIVPPETAILSMYLGPVLSWVEAGTTPDDAAAQVGGMINSLPDDAFTGVLEFFEAEDAIAKLAALDPRVNDHLDWFNQMIAAVLAYFPKEGVSAVVDVTPAPVVDSEPGAPGADDADTETATD